MIFYGRSCLLTVVASDNGRINDITACCHSSCTLNTMLVVASIYTRTSSHTHPIQKNHPTSIAHIMMIFVSKHKNIYSIQSNTFTISIMSHLPLPTLCWGHSPAFVRTFIVKQNWFISVGNLMNDLILF